MRILFFKSRFGKVLIRRDELENILSDTYDEGYEDGQKDKKKPIGFVSEEQGLHNVRPENY